jgi:hypothetical protein
MGDAQKEISLSECKMQASTEMIVRLALTVVATGFFRYAVYGAW